MGNDEKALAASRLEERSTNNDVIRAQSSTMAAVDSVVLEHKKRTYQIYAANMMAPIPEDFEVR